jgi:hypothetical protein
VLDKSPTDNIVQQSRPIVVRTTPTLQTAGLGSVVAQLRSGAALATMLDATFSTFGVISTHSTQYRAASLLGLDLLENPLDANATVCSIMNSPYSARTSELIETWCNNVMFPEEMDKAALELQSYYGDCGLILDDRPWDARYDMSKCTWLWVKHFFSNLGLRKRETGIGLHIRWGDMSYNVGVPSGDPVTPQRSTPVPVAADLLRKMRSCGIQDELSVYMEWHNDTMLSGLGEPYRVVDNDSLDDLLDLASNRIIILDLSSWTVLAHQMADGGLTIVPDVDQFAINWYDNGVNNVLRWHELLSISCPNLIALLNS